MMHEYIGPCAFGIKMGLVTRGSDLHSALLQVLGRVHSDGLLSDRDAVCITESVLARAQDNYITTDELAAELRTALSVDVDGAIGVVFPITSRNRFALVLEGIASAVPEGRVIVQLSYPFDEVGNQILPPDVAEKLEQANGDCLDPDALPGSYRHPLTGVDYTRFYRDIIAGTGAAPQLMLCNDPVKILDCAPDAVIAADIHTRERTRRLIKQRFDNVITLQDVFHAPDRPAWSEWGLLGSNMASGNKLKLAPHDCDRFVTELQDAIRTRWGKNVEVIVYGDGAYKDPSSGIYELADPCAAFGATKGVTSILRTGVKLKYMIDLYQEQGKTEAEIASILAAETHKKRAVDASISEGTTPRRMADILASLADLVSGSADAGTPLVLIKGLLGG